jgi:hypothetical protein
VSPPSPMRMRMKKLKSRSIGSRMLGSRAKQTVERFNSRWRRALDKGLEAMERQLRLALESVPEKQEQYILEGFFCS